MSATASGEAITQCLSFSIAGEEFAVNILRVKEIIEYGTLTRVPGMPPSLRGVINLRGRVVPVVDLAVLFDLPVGEITRRSCIVVVEVATGGEPMVMGIIADAVSQVMDLGPDDLVAAPSFGSHVEADYLEGIAQAGKKFVMILDIDRTLSAEELLAHASVVAAAQAQAAAPTAAPPGPLEE